MNKRVVRFDSADRAFREDEALFREDFMAKNKGVVLFSGGARIGAFLHDSAHVTASGVFPYNDGKGGIRMEYRPAEELRSPLFLDSLQGVPMTMLHPKSTKTAVASMLGMVKSAGKIDEVDADNVEVRSEVVVYDSDSVTSTEVRGLSLGFTCDLVEESGLTPWGEKYDAIQRNLRADHLAIVPNPRVKTARLNLDDDDNEGRPKMPQIRLDNGCEYEAAQEVIAELHAVRGKLTAEASRADSATAEADGLKAKLDGLQAQVDKFAQDSDSIKAAAFEQAKARLALEETAASHKVTVKSDASDLELMTAVVKAVRGDSFDPTGKSDAYIQAAYDLAKADSAPATTGTRRTMLHGDSTDEGKKRDDANDTKSYSASKAQAGMLEGLGR